VRDFIAEFAGLSGTAKRRDICEKIGAQRLTLAEFFAKGDDVVHDRQPAGAAVLLVPGDRPMRGSATSASPGPGRRVVFRCLSPS
jgi:hypothetical protein